MVEVFKTNVENPNDASWLLEQINRSFANYTASFDLEDCDRILRIQCINDSIDCLALISLLNNSGFKIIVLEDDMTSELISSKL